MRGEIITTVLSLLSMTVAYSDMLTLTQEHFIQLTVVLGLHLVFVSLFRFSILCFSGLAWTTLFLCCLLLLC